MLNIDSTIALAGIGAGLGIMLFLFFLTGYEINFDWLLKLYYGYVVSKGKPLSYLRKYLYKKEYSKKVVCMTACSECFFNFDKIFKIGTNSKIRENKKTEFQTYFNLVSNYAVDWYNKTDNPEIKDDCGSIIDNLLHDIVTYSENSKDIANWKNFNFAIGDYTILGYGCLSGCACDVYNSALTEGCIQTSKVVLIYRDNKTNEIYSVPKKLFENGKSFLEDDIKGKSIFLGALSTERGGPKLTEILLEFVN